MPQRPCPGPADGSPPCPTRALVTVKRGSKTAPRCPTCRQQWQHAKDGRRPLRRTYAEQQRRAIAVNEWVMLYGWWCPGIQGQVERHPSQDLTAEHVDPVATSGNEQGWLIVLCRSCNSKLGARLSHR